MVEGQQPGSAKGGAHGDVVFRAPVVMELATHRAILERLLRFRKASGGRSSQVTGGCFDAMTRLFWEEFTHVTHVSYDINPYWVR